MLLAVCLLALVAFTACRSDSPATPTPTPPLSNKSEGILTGSVTIGPICPVEPCDQPIGDLYSSRELLVQREGKEPIRVLLEADGVFSAVLPSGEYTVDLTDCEFLGCSFELPVTIIIEDGKTVRQLPWKSI